MRIGPGRPSLRQPEQRAEAQGKTCWPPAAPPAPPPTRVRRQLPGPDARGLYLARSSTIRAGACHFIASLFVSRSFCLCRSMAVRTSKRPLRHHCCVMNSGTNISSADTNNASVPHAVRPPSASFFLVLSSLRHRHNFRCCRSIPKKTCGCLCREWNISI